MRAAIASLLFLLAAAAAPCGSRVVVLCYNVQNLFDERLDGGEYPEFRPPAWDREQAEAKLAAIAQTIRRASANAPDLIALQEVENRAVLQRLRERHLASFGYRWAVLVEQPGVATQTAVLSRLPVVRTAVHDPGTFAGQPLRQILEIEIEHQGRRLVLLSNHWKSKTGGVAATAEGRRRAARVVRRRLEELLGADPAADVLVLGDFNENLDELPGQLPVRDSPEPPSPGVGFALYDPWYELPPEGRGSSAYRGRWQTPDHILLSPGLLDGQGFDYHRGSFRVVRQRRLLDPATGFPLGFRAPGEGRGAAGASDHLPLVLELEIR